MPIYHISEDNLNRIEETSFGVEGIYERRDIQRLLKNQIEVLGGRLMVISEEFGDWVDSSRRIDLLCLDGDANLVVVEIKRTEDGGHMELQSLRYAAMVSAMTFRQMVDSHARFLDQNQPDVDSAQNSILQFLGWNEVYEDQFGQDTKIILASADFSRELTTSVIWLNERDIDIRCVRLKPYRMESGVVLLDIQQIIPLPEATDFQTQIGVKRQAERQNRTERHDLRFKFWEALLEFARTKTSIHANRSPSQDGWISGGIDRAGFNLTYSIRQYDSQVELWIALGTGQSERNTAAFQALLAQKCDIENDFGGELEWQELPDREGCRIRKIVEGGYRSPLEEWPAIHEQMVNAMINLDRAMRRRVAELSF